MKITGLFNISFLLLLTATIGQAQQLARKVTLRYSNEKLGNVLTDISTSYDVRFSYSADFIPVDQRVSVHIVDQPLSVALDDLFEYTSVQYASMGGQVVLKKVNGKSELSQLQTLPPKVRQTTPIYQEPKPDRLVYAERRRKILDREKQIPPEPIKRKKLEQIPGGDSMKELDLEKYKFKPADEDYLAVEDDHRLAQISILPYVGTNALRSNEMTNNFSFNLFWGTNGGVEGVEVGGFVNTVIRDVYGVQVAGLGNTVGGNLVGTQVSSLFNYTKGRVQGLQVAGLFNVSGEADAVQVSCLFNMARGNYSGVQVGGLFNTSSGRSGVQAAAVFNASKKHTRTQIAGLVNVAGDVSGGQMSALLNVGKKVDGFQFGLINIADTITGAPIGLLNIVKHGYNRVEFSGGEALLANLALKLGARKFYNIFAFGGRWDDVNYVNEQNQTVEGRYMTWALGYGIGTAITFSPRTLMNIEAVAMHVNEKEAWTNELNLLNQLKLLMDFRIGNRTSVFAGPTANVMVSRLVDPETGLIGSGIGPYTMHEETWTTLSGETNVKMWLGFNAGIRF